MKSIEEQTREAAENHYQEWNKYPSNGVKEDCIDDFEAGAEWERNRDKWISVKDELPPHGLRILVLYTWTWDNHQEYNISMGRYIGTFLIFGHQDINGYQIISWQPLPEPPKKKVKS